LVADLRAQLLEQRRAEAVPVAEEARCRGIDLERIVVIDAVGKQLGSDVRGEPGERRDARGPLARSRAHDELVSADAQLDIVGEERRAEACARVAQPDLAVRALASGCD